MLDMWYSSRAIYASIGMSAVYCMLFIWVMSTYSEYLAWAAIFLTWVGLGGATFFCWGLYSDANVNVERLVKMGGVDVKDVDEQRSQANFFMFLMILAASGFVGFMCCVICLWEGLQLAIDVIDASSDFLADTYRIIWTPIVHFLFQLIIFFVWIGCFACVVSLNDIQAS